MTSSIRFSGANRLSLSSPSGENYYALLMFQDKTCLWIVEEKITKVARNVADIKETLSSRCMTKIKQQKEASLPFSLFKAIY